MPSHKSIAWTYVLQLALSSVALVAPVVMLRRYRRGIIAQNLQEAPRRRGGGQCIVPMRLHSPPIRPRPTSQTMPITAHPPLPLKIHVLNKDIDEQYFNAPLYTLKAFGIATALVTLGATASIWGIMKALDASDVRLRIT